MALLLLASTSPWRRELLASVGLPAETTAPGVDEEAVRASRAAWTPAGLASTLAAAKADAVAARHPGRWVLGADQVVHQDGVLFGKPADPDDHLRRLQAMRGRRHELVTGWALRGPGDPADGVVVTRLEVREDLSDDELRAYVASGEGAGCAGGYMAERGGARLLRAVDGDWFNVIGLPVLEVWHALRARGWRIT